MVLGFNIGTWSTHLSSNTSSIFFFLKLQLFNINMSLHYFLLHFSYFCYVHSTKKMWLNSPVDLFKAFITFPFRQVYRIFIHWIFFKTLNEYIHVNMTRVWLNWPTANKPARSNCIVYNYLKFCLCHCMLLLGQYVTTQSKPTVPVVSSYWIASVRMRIIFRLGLVGM